MVADPASIFPAPVPDGTWSVVQVFAHLPRSSDPFGRSHNPSCSDFAHFTPPPITWLWDVLCLKQPPVNFKILALTSWHSGSKGEPDLFPCISLFPGADLSSVFCAKSLTNACSDTSDPSGGTQLGPQLEPPLICFLLIKFPNIALCPVGLQGRGYGIKGSAEHREMAVPRCISY